MRLSRHPLVSVLLFAAALDAQTYLFETSDESSFVDGHGGAFAALDDLDGDGTNDFAVGAPGFFIGAPGSVFLHSGRDGSVIDRLEAPATLINGNLGRVVISIPDIDGDGLRDLIASARGTASSFAHASPTPANSGLVAYSTGTGDALWQVSSDVTSIFAGLVAIDDIDDDGKDDIAAGVPLLNEVQFLSSASGDTLNALAAPATTVKFGTYVDTLRRSDNSTDLVVSSATRIAAFRDDGTLRWSVDFVARDLTVADLNGDGTSDVAATSLSRVVGLCGETGDEILDVPGVFWHIEGLDDMDGDGRDELLVGQDKGPTVAWIISSTGAPLRSLITSGSIAGIGNGDVGTIGDIDGDGLRDFASGHPGHLGGSSWSLPRTHVFGTRDQPLLVLTGSEVAGSSGAPVITATGTPSLGSTVTIGVEAAPFAPVAIAVGGILSFPNPPSVSLFGASLFITMTDATGALTITQPWPRADAGTLAYVQALVLDTTVPGNVASSATVQVTSQGP